MPGKQIGKNEDRQQQKKDSPLTTRRHQILITTTLMLSQNETLELNSWVLNYISHHPKTKAIGSNYGILEQSAIYYNSQNKTGPRSIQYVSEIPNDLLR